MSIIAVIENDTIKLPAGIHLPDGTKVEVSLPDEPASEKEPGHSLSWMLKHAGTVDGPEDFAAEHDHYIHGTAKRSLP